MNCSFLMMKNAPRDVSFEQYSISDLSMADCDVLLLISTIASRIRSKPPPPDGESKPNLSASAEAEAARRCSVIPSEPQMLHDRFFKNFVD